MKTLYIYQKQRGDQSLGKRWTGAVALIILSLCLSCAQVPKESVELSATVGRDIAEMSKSHRQTVLILYGRIKSDVNKLVDEVYAPYQIHNLLKADQEDFKAGKSDTLFAVMDTATKNPDNPDAQKIVLEFMDVFLQIVRDEVESYRKVRLAPVLAQENEVLSAIDSSYKNIQYGNLNVTAHLASIVKVHNAQEEILNQVGVKELRKKIGQTLANTSDKVAKYVEVAKDVNIRMDDAEEKINKISEKLDSFFKEPEEK